MVPPGLLAASASLAALTWGPYALDPNAWPGLTGAVVVNVVVVANLVLTANRSRKIAVVRAIQHWLLNPVIRGAYAIGLNPLGLVVLETRGRVSGQPRREPVGNGRNNGHFWIVAEHGLRANWVRNVLADPRVRVRVRVGVRHRWLDGIAEVLPADDPLARQRTICRWHLLRAMNAMIVRVLGTDLVTVRVTPVEAQA